MVAIGFITLFVLTKERGFLNYISALNLRAQFFNNRGVYYYLLLFIPIAFLFWLSCSIPPRTFSKKVMMVLLFLVSLAGTARTGSKLNVMILVVGTMIIWHYLYKKIDLKFIAITGTAMLVFLVIGGYVREPGTDFAKKIREGVARCSVSNNIMVDCFHLVARGFLPHEELMIPLYFIPTSMSGSKTQFRMGRVFTSTFFPQMEQKGLMTLSPGILGEGFMNFYVFGIFFNMFLFGLMYRSLYVFLTLDIYSRQRVLIYSVALPIMLRIIKGGFTSAFPLFLSFFLPIFISLFFATIRKEKSRLLPA